MAAKNVSKPASKGVSKTAAKSSRKKVKVVMKSVGGKAVSPIKVIFPVGNGKIGQMFSGSIDGKKGFMANADGSPISWNDIESDQ